MVTLSSCLISDCDRLTEDADFDKKIIFSDEAHFNLGGYVKKQNCRVWGTENPHAYIEKPTNPKPVTVWCGFWSRGIIGPFYSQKLKIWKLKRRILATFGFNGTALRAIKPKLHSMMKIALSAGELMSFGHHGTAI